MIKMICFFEMIIENLTISQQMILKKRYIHMYNDAEIGKLMGISRQAVGKNKRKALTKLKEMLKDKE